MRVPSGAEPPSVLSMPVACCLFQNRVELPAPLPLHADHRPRWDSTHAVISGTHCDPVPQANGHSDVIPQQAFTETIRAKLQSSLGRSFSPGTRLAYAAEIERQACHLLKLLDSCDLCTIYRDEPWRHGWWGRLDDESAVVEIDVRAWINRQSQLE
jgi:hypothetical protein